MKPESRAEQDHDAARAGDELEGDESNHSSTQYNGESSSKVIQQTNYKFSNMVLRKAEKKFLH